MHERIKTLAEQAHIHFDDSKQSRIHFVSTDTLEKFAELIVKECVSVLDPNGEYTEKYKNSHTPGPNGLRTILPEEHFYEMKAANKLKEHFGVEE